MSHDLLFFSLRDRPNLFLRSGLACPGLLEENFSLVQLHPENRYYDDTPDIELSCSYILNTFSLPPSFEVTSCTLHMVSLSSTVVTVLVFLPCFLLEFFPVHKLWELHVRAPFESVFTKNIDNTPNLRDKTNVRICDLVRLFDAVARRLCTGPMAPSEALPTGFRVRLMHVLLGLASIFP